MTQELVERFLRYAKQNTRSDASSQTVPSTSRQIDFARGLKEELTALGFAEVELNSKNYFVTATLPATIDEDVPVVGFISHYDTADFESEGVNPKIIENYDGQSIQLDPDGIWQLTPEEFPNLANYVGQTLITTDGTTLLGSDDKSGIAEIITAAYYLLNHPEIKHGKVRMAFGPDEEIGRGADLFDVEHFGCDYAYTVDGGPVGELQYESFNAAQADLVFQGKNVHPGSAKDAMVNAIELMRWFLNSLPASEVPEKTAGREGFYHVTQMQATVEEGSLSLIIRDHDRDKFQARKAFIEQTVQQINAQLGESRIDLTLFDQYYNMAEVIEQDMRPIEIAKRAMANLDIQPIIEPIRGGTDGSKISFMGLPTPNLFAGGENFHGRYEYVSVQAMEKAKDTIIEIIKEVAK